MRKVLSSHAEVAHVWAAMVQPEGRSSDGRMYFNGPDLYSYGSHFVLGRVMTAPGNGVQGVALLNADKYSVSTGKHKSLTWRAVSHFQTFDVPGLTDLCRNVLDRMGRTYQLPDIDRGEETAPGNYRGWRNATPAEVRARDKKAIRDYLTANAAAVSPDAAAYLLGLAGLKGEEFPRLQAAKAKADAKAREAAAKRERDSALADARTLLSIKPADLPARIARLESYTSERTSWKAGERVREMETRGALPNHIRDVAKAHKAAKAAGFKPARVAALWAILKALRAEVAARENAYAIREGNRYLKGQAATFRAALAAHGRGVATSRDYWGLAEAARTLAKFLPANSPMGQARAAALLATAESAMARNNELRPIEEAAAKREREERAERLKAEAAERAAKALADREAWQAGHIGVRYSGTDENGRAYIRAVDVKRDESGQITGGEIETSQGARVPLPHAVRAFKFLKLCHDSGRTWRANGRTLPVGHYKVSEVNPDGLTAGCHRIAWAEVERVARGLGIFEAPADESALEETAHA